MKLPRDLSGRDLILRLRRTFGYRQIHREGSHVTIEGEPPRGHRITVPDHKAIRPGTLNGILRAIAQVQGMSKEELLRRLFT